jgi:nicotinate-nucleotide adenylyltransferase
MHIALFGGAFDPPHLGHSTVSRSLLDAGLVDEVWYVPVYEHPWADRLHKKMTAYEDRLEMVRLTLQSGERVEEYKAVSYTYDTLQYFSQHHPGHTFSWVMGSEYLAKFADFLAGHPKLLDFHFFIYPRAGFSMNFLYQNMTALAEMKEVELSSTKVRTALMQGESIKHMVHASVEEYIDQKKLKDFWLASSG